MTIHIEIGKSYVSDRWRIRSGDIQGSTEHSNITKEELINEIRELINEEDDGHDSNCEGNICFCSARLKKDKKQREDVCDSVCVVK